MKWTLEKPKAEGWWFIHHANGPPHMGSTDVQFLNEGEEEWDSYYWNDGEDPDCDREGTMYAGPFNAPPFP